VHVLEKLGFARDERVVVVHVDDIGMCRSANAGAVDALDATATSGSIMVPCPAFDEAARIARERPDLDLGVHLTLNAEWDAVRWGPLSDSPGLRDPEGMLWRAREDVIRNAGADEVHRELRAQVVRALDAGIDVTHVDSHMGTVFDPKFVRAYFEVAREFGLPAFLPRLGSVRLSWRQWRAGLLYRRLFVDARAQGFAIFDHFCSASLHFQPGQGYAHNRERLSRLGPGLSYLITHCARGDEDLRLVARDWQLRDEERRIYSDGSMARVLEELGFRTIGMRPLRDLLRTGRASA
jgi:predicted glycoside hydrolase/deacetylase ChbG (UPF0249 family)